MINEVEDLTHLELSRKLDKVALYSLHFDDLRFHMNDS